MSLWLGEIVCHCGWRRLSVTVVRGNSVSLWLGGDWVSLWLGEIECHYGWWGEIECDCS